MKVFEFPSRHRRQNGSAVIVMVALLALLLLFVLANLKALYNFDRELRLLEKRQVRRLEKLTAPSTPTKAAGSISTNAPRSD